MRITSVDIIALKKSDESPMAPRPILCRVNTDEGLFGTGEAAVAIGSGARGAFELLRDLAPMVLGKDPLHNEVIWELLFKRSFWGQGNGAIEMASISAIDIALWDIKGKAANMPLYQLLGGKQRDTLRTYASQLQFGWKMDPNKNGRPHQGELEFYRQSTQNALDEGYDAIKTNFIRFHEDGRPATYRDNTVHMSRQLMKAAEARLAATRELVGPDVDIILENHAMTDAETAVQFSNMAAKYDILFYEECATPMNPAVMKRVADRCSIPIATGERIYTRWGFLPFLENGSIGVAQPDIGNCGGVTECKKICDMAHVYDVGIQTHVCSSPISVAVSLHLEAAIPNFFIHEHHFSNAAPFMTRYCKYDYQPVKGQYSIPELPGIGQELSEQALAEAEIVTVKL